MTLKLKLAGAALVVAGIAAGVGVQRYWFAPPAAVTASRPVAEPVRTLPDFSLQDRDGELLSIRKDFAGKSLVLNFWATWCAPCRREIPLLMKLSHAHAADGVQVVGVAVDFREDVLKYADAMKIDYPLLIGEQDGLAAVDAFGLAAVGFPFTVFTDAQGNIVTMHLGELKADEAALVLDAVKRVNRGELALETARTQVTAGLSRLATATAAD